MLRTRKHRLRRLGVDPGALAGCPGDLEQAVNLPAPSSSHLLVRGRGVNEPSRSLLGFERPRT